MDDATLGLVGAIVGVVGGIGGGVIGAYCATKNAKTPEARRHTTRFGLYVWTLVWTLLVLQFALPFPYNGLVWLPYGLALGLLIRWGNRQQAAMRQAAEAEDLSVVESETD